MAPKRKDNNDGGEADEGGSSEVEGSHAPDTASPSPRGAAGGSPKRPRASAVGSTQETSGAEGNEASDATAGAGDVDKVEFILHSDLDKSNTIYKVKKGTLLQKVFKKFSEKKSIPVEDLKFTFDGKFLNARSTVGNSGLQDGDVVEVTSKKDGGGLV